MYAKCFLRFLICLIVHSLVDIVGFIITRSILSRMLKSLAGCLTELSASDFN